MDLVYMPEVLTYGSFRTPVYRDYEQPWNKNYFNYNGKSTSNQLSRQQREQLQQQQLRANHKDNCELCKESKRRSLGTYIRRRSRTTSCSEIHEEEEEDDKDNAAAVAAVKPAASGEKKIETPQNNDNNDNNKNKEKSKDNSGERKTDKFSLLEIKKSICRLDKAAIK